LPGRHGAADPVEFAEDHGSAKCIRQVGDLLVERGQRVRIGPRWIAARDFGDAGEERFCAASAHGISLQGGLASHAVQKAPDCRPGVNAMGLPCENQEGGLVRVFGEFVPAEHSPADGVHFRAVPVDEFRERVFVPARDERVEQFGVGPRTGQAVPELVDDPRDRDRSHLSLLTAARRVTLYTGETGGARRWESGFSQNGGDGKEEPTTLLLFRP
jgi:hypothetical protein